MRGRYSFTNCDLQNEFKLSTEAIKKPLQRLKANGEIALIRKEFYVIIPPEYRSMGVLPPALFADDLMKFLEKDYYTALLNAAAFYGAAHQQPQEFFIITVPPTVRNIESDRMKINFSYKNEWSSLNIRERKTPTGYLKVSSPELTALDLIAYYDLIGGFDRVATILEELSDEMEPNALLDTARRYNKNPIVQRLGYLLEVVLNKRELALALYGAIEGQKYIDVLLQPNKKKESITDRSDRWRVMRNIEIETDDL